MRLVVIAGFLGSGKTTAMLAFAGELSRAGRRVALIVNEIGEIGVDIDRADAGDDLFVMDRLAGRFVDLLEAHRRTRFGRRIDLDRDRDQSEPDLPLPICACRHAVRSFVSKPIR